jgi:MFS family permease
MTASQSLIPNLVPREHLLNAVALNQLSQQGSRLIGPAVVAPALLIAGPDVAFAVSTMFYVTGIFGVLQIQTRSSGNLKAGATIGSSMMEAGRYVWHQPQLRSIFALVALHCSMTMAFESMLPVFARDVLTESKAGVSYLMMGAGAGAVVAVILIAGYRGEVGRGRLLLALGMLSGLSMLALASAPTLPAALGAMALMGGSQAGFMAISAAMVQSLAPDEMRGRISGLNQINVGGTMALVNLINGFAADAYGAPTVLVVMGLSFISVMTLSLAFGTVRGVYGGSISLGTRST